MFMKTSKQLESAIVEVLQPAQGTPCFYKIRFIFTQSDSDWTYEPDKLSGMNLEKQFVGTYFDYVSIGFEAHPLDIIDLLNKSQDLYCTIIAVPHSWRNFLPYEEDQFVEKFRVIVEKPEDLMKQMNLDKFTTISDEEALELRHREVLMPLTLQLMDDFVYESRHRRINAMFGNGSTVSQAIQFALNGLEIAQSDIADIDNTAPLNNMTIPPVHGMDSVFTYLQQAYGIFSKGLGAYYTDDTMYIWPPFETNPQSETTFHILLAPPDNFEAQECYHYKNDDGDISVVSNTGADTKNTMEHGAENIGTDQIMTNADKLIDHSGQMTGTGDYKLSENRVSGAALAKDNIKVTDSQNVQARGTSANIYTASSTLAANSGVQFACGWKVATLEHFRPGQKVMIHYDDDKGRYTTQTGTLTGIIYKMQRTSTRAHPEPFWIFNASVSAFLEPEKKEE